MEQIRAELADIAREKRALETPAYLWERYASHCSGACRHPVPVAVDISGTFIITCCSVFVAHKLLATARVTERLLRERLRKAA